jgi:hypothetical protein
MRRPASRSISSSALYIPADVMMTAAASFQVSV